MNRLTKALVAIMLICALGLTVLAAQPRTIPNRATIEPVASLTFSVSFIDWGVLSPGQSYAKAFTARNTGNIPVALNVTAQNWQPLDASLYLGLSSNATGYILAPGRNATISLVLAVAANAPPMDFAFDVKVA